MDDILEIAILVAEACDRLGLPYVVAGSLASSLHGIPRATEDVDIVVRIRLGDVDGLVAALRPTFYLDEDAVRTAVANHASFNVVHLGNFLKADIFVAKEGAPSRLELERGRRVNIGGSPPRELRVATAEDVIAQKLYWFKLGDEVSDRQWRDATGVLKVSGARLDFQYLQQLATLLGVDEQLRRALEAVGLRNR